ncbi:MAG TPA: hypothetical protein VGB07_13170 [Blastocatellia bacterium]
MLINGDFGWIAVALGGDFRGSDGFSRGDTGPDSDQSADSERHSKPDSSAAASIFSRRKTGQSSGIY